MGYTSLLWSKSENERLKDAGFFRERLNPEIDDETYNLIEDIGIFLDEQIGRFGIEKTYARLLAGKHGVKFIEHNFVTGEDYELSRIPSIPGQDIYLTIDKSLQEKVTRVLADKVGSVIVLDVTNGEIWAMANAPTYDPNALQGPVTQETVQYLFRNPQKPLLPRAISGEYALGSIFKIITACAGLGEGKITVHTPFTCEGTFFKTARHFRCWIASHNQTHGTLELPEALQHSCNIFFFNVGKLAGPTLLANWAHTFGLGGKTGVDLPEERSGLVPDPQWKQQRYSQKWALADTLNMSIGQGDLMVTPIQVVRVMAAVANGGYLVRPHLLSDEPQIADSESPVKSEVQNPESGIENDTTALRSMKIDIDPTYLEVIRHGLYKVVHEEGGTAHNLGLNDFPVAGKTSTAETNLGGDSSLKSHSWFAGFGPYDNPRFAFVVMIEHGGKGSETAVPLAAQFLTEALDLANRLAQR